MQLVAVDRLPEESSCLENQFYDYDSSNYRLSMQIYLQQTKYSLIVFEITVQTYLIWTSGLSLNGTSRWCSSSSLKKIAQPVQSSSKSSLLKSNCIAFDVSNGNLIEVECDKELVFACEVCYHAINICRCVPESQIHN
jgi:hypothetical protein